MFGDSMLVPFPSKKPLQLSAVFPLDFYRFRHRTKVIHSSSLQKSLELPLWIVGSSPFDVIINLEEGHVVHLDQPRFIARWSMCDQTMGQIDNPDFYDEDLNIMLYETIPLDKGGVSIEEWFDEAVCAVAYTKGLIAISEPEEMQ